MRIRDEIPKLDGATIWYNSEPIDKQDLIGNRPILIHFWSVSCELCKNTMPLIKKIRDDYKNELNVIAVHMPRSEKDLDLELVKRVAEKHDISQPIFVDNDHTLTDAFRNKHVPAYYVFDMKGKLRHYQTGSGGLIMLQKRIDRVLGK